MSNQEFRVRPVIRHAVTEYTPGFYQGDRSSETAKSALIGEFPNEQMAEKVREALEFQAAPRAYLMVKRTFDLDTQAQHADSLVQAEAFVADRLANGEEWRVFERVLTDPVAIARASQNPLAAYEPYGVNVAATVV